MVYISKESKFQIYVMKGSSSMKKVNNRKGFTLAELLIVVAIIAVLVAIAIPVFTSQLEKAREATDLANVRSAYATVVVKFMGDGKSASVTVPAKQTVSGWNYESGEIQTMVEGEVSKVDVSNHTAGTSYTIAIDSSGSVKLT